MAHASIATIKGWMTDGKAADANFLLVACDQTGDGGCCYPIRVWAKVSDDVHQAVHKAMAEGRVEMVFDLRADHGLQLAMPRAYLSPRGTQPQETLHDAPSTEDLVEMVHETKARTKTANSGRATVKPKLRPPVVVDTRTELQRALEQGGPGGLAGQLKRAVNDEEES